MDIKKLKAAIAKLPDHMEVLIEIPERDFTHTIVAGTGVCLVPSREEPDGPVLSKEKCFVITAY